MFLFGVQKGGPIPIVADWKKESIVNKIHGARVEYTSKCLDIYYYIHREIQQILMDLDFHPLFQCWGKFYLPISNYSYIPAQKMINRKSEIEIMKF